VIATGTATQAFVCPRNLSSSLGDRCRKAPLHHNCGDAMNP
jgi:hypothetical protein